MTGISSPWLADLKAHAPCTEGYAWARDNNIASLPDALSKLPRADWWLWLAHAYGVDLDKPRLVTFAADCAERVLPKFEARYPDDQRPRQAIEAARAWVTCPSPGTQSAAAYAAADAYDAASDAAYAAAYASDAERSWQADALAKGATEATGASPMTSAKKG